MSENYLSNLERRLNDELDEIIDGNSDRDKFVKFVCEEVRGSFTRGLQAGRAPRKTASQKRSRSHR